MAGELLGDGGPQIAVMRMQELLQRTYGINRVALLPEIHGPARRYQLEQPHVIVNGMGLQRLPAGAIVDNEAVLNQLRDTKAHLRPIG